MGSERLSHPSRVARQAADPRDPVVSRQAGEHDDAPLAGAVELHVCDLKLGFVLVPRLRSRPVSRTIQYRVEEDVVARRMEHAVARRAIAHRFSDQGRQRLILDVE